MRAPDAGLHARERFGCRRHVSRSPLEELRDECVVFDHQSAPTNVGRSRSRPWFMWNFTAPTEIDIALATSATDKPSM